MNKCARSNRVLSMDSMISFIKPGICLALATGVRNEIARKKTTGNLTGQDLQRSASVRVFLAKGRCRNDVCTEGDGGGPFHVSSTMTIWTPTFEQWLFTKRSIHHEQIEHRITEQFKNSTYSQLIKCCLNIKILKKNTIEQLVNWPTVSKTI